MPIIMNNLRNTILTEAKTIISEHGYETLSMRSLAKQVGIAVGTLYNYYPNKNELLLEVLQESWQGTFQSIEAIDPENEDALEKYITILYDDIVKRKGLGQILISCDLSPHALNNIKGIFRRLEDYLTEILEFRGSSDPRRKAISMIITLSQLNQRFSDEREQNIAFLMTN